MEEECEIENDERTCGAIKHRKEGQRWRKETQVMVGACWRPERDDDDTERWLQSSACEGGGEWQAQREKERKGQERERTCSSAIPNPSACQSFYI